MILRKLANLKIYYKILSYLESKIILLEESLLKESLEEKREGLILLLNWLRNPRFYS